MPNKGQKVAKRQNQLRNRKRRGPGRSSTQNFEVGPTVSTTNVDDEDGGAAVATAPAAIAEAAPASTRRRRSRQEVEDQGSPAYQFLGGELRHIGIVTAVIVIILVAVTFTLGGAI